MGQGTGRLGTVDGMDSPCLRLARKTRETKGLEERTVQMVWDRLRSRREDRSCLAGSSSQSNCCLSSVRLKVGRRREIEIEVCT